MPAAAFNPMWSNPEYRSNRPHANDRDAYTLAAPDHLNDTRPPITWGIPLTAETQPKKLAEPLVLPLSPTQTLPPKPTGGPK